MTRTLAIVASAVGAAAASPEVGDLRGEVAVIRRSVGSQAAGPQDAVVFLEDAPAAGEMPRGPFALTQVDKTFYPPLLIVPRGEAVSFPNQDTLQHNVFSLSPTRPFDLGLYEPGASRSVTFDRPGIVAVYCNIHPQMIAHIVVVSNPFFTRPAPGGAFALRGVPAGTYHLVAWFPFGKPTREQVKIEAGHQTRVKLVVREAADATRHGRKDGTPYAGY